jgi:hypothetical protein
LRFAGRFVGCDVGLRRRANIELQPPRTLAPDFAAPQVDRADLAEAGMQMRTATVPRSRRLRVFSAVRIGGRADICSGSNATSSPGWSVSRTLDVYSGNSTGSETSRSNCRSARSIVCPGSAVAGTRQIAAVAGSAELDSAEELAASASTPM